MTVVQISGKRSEAHWALRVPAFACLLLGFAFLSVGNALAQQPSNQSQQGIMFPKAMRPVLDMKITEPTNQMNIMYPNARNTLALVVYNRGNMVAEDCWLKIESDSPFLTLNTSGLDLFTLEPGDSMFFSIPLAIRRNATPGPARLSFGVEEMTGYHMFPEREASLYIGENPIVELVVVDTAIVDQRGLGYFEKFEPVELHFRIKNCSERIFHNVLARMDLSDNTISSRRHPELRLGTMEPGEYRDVNTSVTSVMASRQVGLQMTLEADGYHYSQEFKFSFLADYKGPDEMSPNGCTDVPFQGGTFEAAAFPALPPRPGQDGKVAIVIINSAYLSYPELSYAYVDGNAFNSLLKNHLGFKEENILVLSDLNNAAFEQLFSLSGSVGSQVRRMLRQGWQGKDLVFFYVGYGAADMHSREAFFLPVNHNLLYPDAMPSLSRVFSWLSGLKAENNLNSVTSYLHINYALISRSGNNDLKSFQFVQLHSQLSGFATFLSSDARQAQILPGYDLVSPFVSTLIRGFEGMADMNRDKKIHATELFRILRDEISGVPYAGWKEYHRIQVPLFLGVDSQLY